MYVYLFFDLHDNTVLVYISKIVQDRGLISYHYSHIGSHV